MSDNNEHKEVLLESVTVQRILKADGDEIIRYDIGDITNLAALGLLSFAQHAVYSDAYNQELHTDDEDEEDD